MINPVNCPGPGDEETWPPCFGHSLDPRTENDGWGDDESDENEEEDDHR